MSPSGDLKSVMAGSSTTGLMFILGELSDLELEALAVAVVCLSQAVWWSGNKSSPPLAVRSGTRPSGGGLVSLVAMICAVRRSVSSSG